MPNSADKSLPLEAALREDSDVIELTEEVQDAIKQGDKKPNGEGSDLQDDFDIFGDLSMPEFRVPQERGDANTPAQGVPQAAILGRKARSRQLTPSLETLKLDLEQIERSIQQQQEEAEALGEESSADLEEGVVPAGAQQEMASEDAPLFDFGADLDESSVISLDSEVEIDEPAERALPDPEQEIEPSLLRERPENMATVQIPSLSRETGSTARLDELPGHMEERLDGLYREHTGQKHAPLDIDEEDEDEEDELLLVTEHPPELGLRDEDRIITSEMEEKSHLKETPLQDELTPGEEDALDAIAGAGDEEDDAYDRQELVRTIQMQPVSRAEIELSIDLERLQHAQPIEDQRYAPDVLITPPRVLTRRWVEGLGILGHSAPLADAAPSQQPPVKPPPPRPAAPQPTRPAGPKLQQQGAAAQPQPARNPTPQQQQPVGLQQQSAPQQVAAPGAPKPAKLAAKPAAPAEGGDAELSGLVQELLDEGTPQPAQQPQQQKAPAQKVRQSPMRENWFKDVFTDEFLRTIPKNIEAITERESGFIERSLSLQSGSRVLDLACGFGRHAIHLTQRKLEVVGLDLSMALLQRALQEAQRRNLSIKFVHGDMRSMNFNEIFDGCYLWQSSFGYFDDLTNFKVLQGVANALKPGGRFMLDVMNRDYIVGEMPSRCWWEGKECIFLEEVDFDYTASVLHTKRSFIYEDGSPPLEQNSFVRLYGLHELLQLMQNAGFRVIEVSGGTYLRSRFLGANSQRMILLAEKLPRRTNG